MRAWYAMLGIVLVCLALLLATSKQLPNDRGVLPRQQQAGPILTARPESGTSTELRSVVARVTKVTFVNGASYDGTVEKALEPMVKAVQEVYPKATFRVDGSQLLVGLEVAGAPHGEIFSISNQSDCPVNSIYRYRESESFSMKVLQPMLVAWTRGRHDHLGLGSAGVKDYTHGEGRAEVILLSQ